MGELESSSVILQSSFLLDPDAMIAEAFLSAITSDPNDCTLRSGEEEADGVCLTPINITGYAASINLGGNGSEGPGRLFGYTSGSVSLDRYGELEVAPFNLKEPITMRASSNLEDAGPDATWTQLIVYTAVLDVQLAIKDEFWTVRFAFISQQPADEEVFDGCVDDHYREKIEQNSGLLSEGDVSGTYRKGDMMVCIKDDANEACDDDEFLWLDLANDSFVSSRPADPHQHLFADYNEPSCEEANPGYDIELGGYELVAELVTPIGLSAEFAEDSCLRTFTYEDQNTGEQTQGNTLTAEFDYDMTEAVFADGFDSDDIASASDAEIFKTLTLQQLWIRNTFSDPAAITGDDMGLSATPEITVTEDEDLSCAEESEIDSQYLTGEDCTPDGEIRTDCTYEACEPDFEEVSGTIWSVTENDGCNEYCTRQSCDDFEGAIRNIHCVPECE